ncbi:hypothetical protein BD626DRAFT_497479 [Schizophyllum amplum]|uniref:Transcription regulator Rua1 C-terminal domain-containing protein n=1 Tax=Schizophyllum amplum TaxID=97359 RepID=A0A550CCE9_9AGAR|nr:hypothetical protein BD626DRAFT_497479 [Auriculariopsis ampla]
MDVLKSSTPSSASTAQRALLDIINLSPASARDYEEPFAIFKHTSFDDIASRLPAPRFSPRKPLELLDRHRASYVSREKLEDLLLLDKDSLQILGSPASDAKDALQTQDAKLSRLPSSLSLSLSPARETSLAAQRTFMSPLSPLRSISSISNLGTPFKPHSTAAVLPSPTLSLSKELPPTSNPVSPYDPFLEQYPDGPYISPIVRQQPRTPVSSRFRPLGDAITKRTQYRSHAPAASSPHCTYASPTEKELFPYGLGMPARHARVFLTPSRSQATGPDSASPPSTPRSGTSPSKLFEMSPLTPLTSPESSPDAPLSRAIRRLPTTRNRKPANEVQSSASPELSTALKRSISPPPREFRKMRRTTRRTRNLSPSPSPSPSVKNNDILDYRKAVTSLTRSRRPNPAFADSASDSSANGQPGSSALEPNVRSSSPAPATDAPSSSPGPSLPIVYTYRDLPPYVEHRLDLVEKVYRRFPASSYYQPPGADSPLELFSRPPVNGTYNAPRDVWDLYTPRFVKGCGPGKVGACPICIEPRERGGRGAVVWFGMKFSAYNYHMQYAHGISATTTRPYSPPVRFRQTRRERIAKGERVLIMEGLCHQCKKWVAVEGVKDVEVKVKELFW